VTLNQSIAIAHSALGAHSQRLQLHALNIANVDTPNYTRKVPILSENQDNSFEFVLGAMKGGIMQVSQLSTEGGVQLSGSVLDPTPHKKVYQPSHPDADANGYVTLSNTNVLADMADATLSSRAYEANLSVVSIVKAMAQRALEIGR
jgi:flagellar basal-body rod protein FlgC